MKFVSNFQSSKGHGRLDSTRDRSSGDRDSTCDRQRTLVTVKGENQNVNCSTSRNTKNQIRKSQTIPYELKFDNYVEAKEITDLDEAIRMNQTTQGINDDIYNDEFEMEVDNFV